MTERRYRGRPRVHDTTYRKELVTVYADDEEMRQILLLSTQERKVALIRASARLHPPPAEPQEVNAKIFNAISETIHPDELASYRRNAEED